jgi:hypothetical protein
MCVNAGFVLPLPGLFTPSPARLRTEIPYEADALGPGKRYRAADNEASPEDEAEVDGELGQGKVTFLFGEICCAYLGVSHLDD